MEVNIPPPSELVQETLTASSASEVKNFSQHTLASICKAYASQQNTGKCFVGKQNAVSNQHGLLLAAGASEVLPEIDDASKYYVWFEKAGDSVTLFGS